MNLKKILTFFKKPSIKKEVEKQLDKNIKAIESLRDYDQGKKTISTVDIQRSFPDIRVSR